jgi:hypothetical protein
MTWTGPDWKPMSQAQERKRLRWLRKQERRGVTSFTLEDIGLLLSSEISRWSEEDKKALREGLFWKMYPVKLKTVQ